MIPHWPEVWRALRSERGYLARYALVGAFVTAADFAMFALLLSASGGRHMIANVAAKMFAAALGFLLHRNYTFRAAPAGSAARQGGAYLGLLAFNLALSAGLVYVLIDVFSAPKLPSRAFSDLVVIAVAFLGSRFVVFRPHGSRDAQDRRIDGRAE